MKLFIAATFLTISSLALANEGAVERFVMSDAELVDVQRAALIKPVTLHASCAKISSINALKPTQKIPTGKKIDLVLVSKKTRYTYAMSGSTVVYKFSSTFGSGYLNGPKIQEGDGRTPEGIYTLDAKNYDSKFHSSMHVSYPSKADRDFAQRYGLSAGGDIMLHGKKWYNSNSNNWTAGCVAMQNDDIDLLMSVVKIPTTVAICPL